MTNQTPTEQQPISQDINDYVSLHDLVLYARACYVTNGAIRLDNRKYSILRECLGNYGDIFIYDFKMINKNGIIKTLFHDINYKKAIEELLNIATVYGEPINIYTYEGKIKPIVIKQNGELKTFLSTMRQHEIIQALLIDIQNKCFPSPSEFKDLNYFDELSKFYISVEHAIKIFTYKYIQLDEPKIEGDQLKAKLNANGNNVNVKKMRTYDQALYGAFELVKVILENDDIKEKIPRKYKLILDKRKIKASTFANAITTRLNELKENKELVLEGKETIVKDTTIADRLNLIIKQYNEK